MSKIISIILCLLLLASCSQVAKDTNNNESNNNMSTTDIFNTKADVENKEEINGNIGTSETDLVTKKEGYKCIVAARHINLK